MAVKKATKTQVKKERNPQKISKIIRQKGYKSGKLPKGKKLHHVKPVATGGKTTKKNTQVVSVGKHKTIHKNRRKRGEI